MQSLQNEEIFLVNACVVDLLQNGAAFIVAEMKVPIQVEMINWNNLDYMLVDFNIDPRPDGTVGFGLNDIDRQYYFNKFIH